MTMIRAIRALSGAAVFALLGWFWSAPVNAQTQARVVATCGGATYTPGLNGAITVDANGNLCSNTSGGGGGTAVTIADGADVAEGTTTDAAATAGGSGTVSAKLRLMTTQLNSLITAVGVPLTGVSQAKTGAAASSLVAKASAGSVISISGSAVAGSYIMLFNATSAPSNGAVTPDKCWGPMSAAGPFVFGWGVGPSFTASTGITVVSSSTGCFTQTLTNAAFIAVEYQ